MPTVFKEGKTEMPVATAVVASPAEADWANETSLCDGNILEATGGTEAGCSVRLSPRRVALINRLLREFISEMPGTSESPCPNRWGGIFGPEDGRGATFSSDGGEGRWPDFGPVMLGDAPRAASAAAVPPSWGNRGACSKYMSPGLERLIILGAVRGHAAPRSSRPGGEERGKFMEARSEGATAEGISFLVLRECRRAMDRFLPRPVGGGVTAGPISALGLASGSGGCWTPIRRPEAELPRAAGKLLPPLPEELAEKECKCCC